MPEKPSDPEEEYFARQEFERRKRDAEARAAKLVQEERDRLRAQHHMRCPKCGMELAEIAFRNVRIDKCTSCGGVWLDAGELETVASADESGVLGRFAGLFKR